MSIGLTMIFIAIAMLIGAWIGSIQTQYGNKTRTTNYWTECTYCTECKIAYSQSGLNMSIYTCPECGKHTQTGMSFRLENGELKVQKG